MRETFGQESVLGLKRNRMYMYVYCNTIIYFLDIPVSYIDDSFASGIKLSLPLLARILWLIKVSERKFTIVLKECWFRFITVTL